MSEGVLFVCVNILLVKKVSIVPAVSSTTKQRYRDDVMNELRVELKH